jgi:hypothetical protein
MTLSLADRELARQLDFAEDVVFLFKKQVQMELQKLTLEKYLPEHEIDDFYFCRDTFPGQVSPGERIPDYSGTVTKLTVEGIFVNVDSANVRELVASLQSQLAERGYLVFAIGDFEVGSQGKIVLIKGENRYDILTIQLTNGDNYEISNRELVHRLQQWARLCSFQIIGADFD